MSLDNPVPMKPEGVAGRIKTYTENQVSYSLLRRAMRVGNKAESELALTWGLSVDVDEVAILFNNESQLQQFSNDIHRQYGWHIFNVVESGLVNEVGLRGSHQQDSYEATYVFVSHLLVLGIRLELMLVRSGQASLHDDVSDPRIMHASWKTPSLEAYESHMRTLDDQLVPIAKEYVSDYGRFSYWGHEAPYLKPRVNLRDQASS